MARHSLITKGRVLKMVRIFKFITRRQLAIFFLGEERRVKRLEQLLPKLEGEGKLASLRHKGSKVYFLPRKNRKKTLILEHEITCTEILIRLWRCRMEESEIMPERIFRGHYIVPDFGLRYSESRNTALLVEFCTKQNFEHGGVVKGKITGYRNGLPGIEEKIEREATVLFVIDAERHRIKAFLKRIKPVLNEPIISGHTGEAAYPFFFTDYKTFKAIQVGKALTSRIYIWHDGKDWTLTNHD